MVLHFYIFIRFIQLIWSYIPDVHNEDGHKKKTWNTHDESDFDSDTDAGWTNSVMMIVFETTPILWLGHLDLHNNRPSSVCVSLPHTTHESAQGISKQTFQTKNAAHLLNMGIVSFFNLPTPGNKPKSHFQLTCSILSSSNSYKPCVPLFLEPTQTHCSCCLTQVGYAVL